MIIIRLVRHDDALSAAIILNIGGEIAHAEAIMKGGTVIGAFAEGGVQERPLDYDNGKFKKEILLALPTDEETEARFEHYLRAPEVMGEKYDFTGIANFVHLGIDLHGKHTVFCSALIHDALRWINWLPVPLPIPGHYVTPIVLQQELLARPDVKIITRDDLIFIAHINAAK
jgi:hypothetical protein